MSLDLKDTRWRGINMRREEYKRPSSKCNRPVLLFHAQTIVHLFICPLSWGMMIMIKCVNLLIHWKELLLHTRWKVPLTQISEPFCLVKTRPKKYRSSKKNGRKGEVIGNEWPSLWMGLTSTVRDICTFAVLCSVTRTFLSLHSCSWRALRVVL